jgi:porphobilinogen synthase|tara:strand:- start:249 stop:1229 length:981 start_codon:yes stop_codon:yes gene_type:complete
MNFPKTRMRRLRYNKILRELVEDTRVVASDLIYPIFITEGSKVKEPINSMPGQYRYSIDESIILCEELLKNNINSIILFGIVSKKDETGEISCNSNSVIPKAIVELKNKFHDKLFIIADVCNCEYTNHGHCGTIIDNDVHNDKSLETLAKQSLILAKSGADALAPSDMMDGRVNAIREILDKNQLEKTPIFPYSVKYSSAFYGPFRDAANSSPSFGDRKTYQMNYKNSEEAINEVKLDLNEGADVIIIKPAMTYLDIICKIKDRFNTPIIAYNVSGEYSMVKSAAKNNFINEMETILEILHSIKRAGANAIISYHALEVAKFLKNK